jgi:hypothetical protein
MDELGGLEGALRVEGLAAMTPNNDGHAGRRANLKDLASRFLFAARGTRLTGLGPLRWGIFARRCSPLHGF